MRNIHGPELAMCEYFFKAIAQIFIYLKCRLIYLFPILLTLLLCACDSRELPQYWICEGETFQQISPHDDSKVVRYQGKEKLLIEYYGQNVNQYTSRPFTGVYKVYKNTNQELIFSMDAFATDSNQGVTWNRRAILNKETGRLYLSERGRVKNGDLEGGGSLDCDFLGNRFPVTAFY